VISSADDEPRGKPHPAVYLTTLRKLNLNASQCLVIEDSFTGFCAAQAAGIATIVIAEDSQHARFQAAAGRYQTLPELLEALNAEPAAVG
jgi:beta-phosphoglucomutase-like phosphatase (HAD superfamily)